MTFISWALESTCGMLSIGYLGFYYSRQSESFESISVIGLMLDQFINFVVIPGSLVLNNDVNKEAVVDHGWCQGLRNSFCNNKVSPQPGINEEHHVAHNLIPLPIGTISGNLDRLSSGSNQDRFAMILQNLNSSSTTNVESIVENDESSPENIQETAFNGDCNLNSRSLTAEHIEARSNDIDEDGIETIHIT